VGEWQSYGSAFAGCLGHGISNGSILDGQGLGTTTGVTREGIIGGSSSDLFGQKLSKPVSSFVLKYAKWPSIHGCVELSWDRFGLMGSLALVGY
jgi:hypothetical protein